MIDVGGHRLHVVRAGRGEPGVLLEAGIAASSLSWTRILPQVAAFTRVFAYDRAGLAWSDRARTPRTVAQMLSELRALEEKTADGGPHVLVGHSFGAWLMCAYAATFPDDTAGLVLVDPPALREGHRPSAQQAHLVWGGIQLSRIGAVLAFFGVVRACLSLLTGGAPAAPRTFVKIFGPTAARTLERLVGEVRKLPPEVHPIVQAHWCQPKCFLAMADHLAALEPVATFVAGIRSLPPVPLVVLSSADSPPDVLADHRALVELSSRGRQVLVAESGHWIPFDRPELVVDAIRAVVAEAAAVR
jgi:pimeloyl-ACP methyl ester carboxylesterase